ncbi:MAG: phosphotransferase [Pseudomonadales bacterium]|nr:phosphotransferase [Pseudomonadales bacterium]NRA18266.1 phosphotransferase [Oceanospirillaceae bacterium]
MQLSALISDQPDFSQLWETHFPAVQKLSSVNTGLSADVLKLTTTEGEIYLLKLSGKSAGYLQNRYKVLCSAHVQSILLPLTFYDIPYLCLNNTILEVYPYISGKHLSCNCNDPEVISQSGKQIALLHQQFCAADFAVDSLKLMPQSFQQLCRELSLAEDILQQKNSPENCLAEQYLKALRSLYSLSQSLCKDLQSRIDNISTPQLIHGDLHGDNIITALNNRLYLIDFNKIMTGHKVFDLAKFIVCSLFSASGEMDKRQVKALLAGYQSHSVICESEQNLLLPLILGLQLNSRWLLRKYSVVPDKVSELIQQNTLQINWINNNFSSFQVFFEQELFSSYC